MVVALRFSRIISAVGLLVRRPDVYTLRASDMTP